MRCRPLLFIFAALPFATAAIQDTQEPKCEDVFKNIKVFKGVPASDLIPAMQFMSASLHFECSDCHDPKDMAVDTRMKESARNMVLLQRDINEKHFRGRLEVTCMTCHHEKERPDGLPIPPGVNLRHQLVEDSPSVDNLLSKHKETVGTSSERIVRTGTLTAPNDATHKMETKPVEFVQGTDGKFQIVSAERKILSDGKEVKYGDYPMAGEPSAIFERVGRAWRGSDPFAGLQRLTLAGQDKIGKTTTYVVRANRPSTQSTEELWFDAKTGLLVRLVNIRRSTIGTVVSAIDYSNYKKVGNTRVPMKVVMTFADGTTWTMDFKTLKVQ